MFKNVASQSVTLYAVDASTGLPKTGDSANMVYYVSKDDGTVTAIASASGVPTEVDATNGKGLYKIALSQSETNGDKLLFSGKSTTANVVVVPAVIYTTPANFSSLGISAAGKISEVVLVDTLTTYTGNTVQTGDAYARIGAAGASLTALGDTRIAHLDADVSSRMATFTLPTNFSSLGISVAGKISEVVLVDTLTTYTGNTVQTGDAYARIGAAGAGLTALGDTRIAHLDADVSSRLATSGYTVPPTAAVIAAAAWDLATSGHTTSGTFGAAMNAAGSAGDPWATSLPGSYGAGTAGNIVGAKLDAAVSSRSTYAGADTSGTTTLLSRLTSGRATNLDNLDAAVSTRSTYAGADTSGTTTLLARLTSGRATNLDNLDAAVSTRSTYSGGAVASVTGAVGSVTAAVTVGTNSDKTGYSLNLAQVGLSPRNLGSIADSALTVGDALVAAVCAAAGQETVVGTTFTVKSPSTATTIRAFTLDSGSAPTSRT